MYTIAPLMAAQRKKWDFTKIQSRLTEAEQKRYEEICNSIRNRNSAILQSYVNKTLLGLQPPDKWVTDREVKYFRGEIESIAVHRKGAARKHTTKSEEKDKVVNGS